MSEVERMGVGVVVERRALDNPWQPERWSVVGLLPGRPLVEPGTLLDRGEGWARHFAGTAEIELFSGETAGYRDNLMSSRPSVYLILRRQDERVAVVAATVDPGEIEIHSDAGDDLIEAFPLPPEVAAWMQGFVDRHHVERAFYKRQRVRADPEALAKHKPLPEDPDD